MTGSDAASAAPISGDDRSGAAASGAAAQLDVVIVAYHSGEMLERCLAMLTTFLPSRSRIIIVDNSPDDPSASTAVARTPETELLREPRNVGFAAAVNHALRESAAPLVLLVNPDIVSIEGSFAAIEELFARRRDAGAVAVRLTNEDGVLEHCRRGPRRVDFFDAPVGARRFLPRSVAEPRSPMLEWDHEEVRDVENATGAFLFLRRAALEDVGQLDERFFMYWEETDWFTRARARGWRLVFTPAVRAVHAGRKGADVESHAHSLLFLESGNAYVRKHFGLTTALLLRLSWILADSARLVRGMTRSEAYRREIRERLAFHLGTRRALR
jgi:N-acetylglucosaminyl-diphospho-decaprenol L-rhamnosyltransferase